MEVVDDEGYPRPEGEEGLLAISHLNARGTVLVRYLVGDVTALRRDACPSCGRFGERLVTQPRRKGELVKIKGMLVNLDQIQHALTGHPSIHEYQIVITRVDPSDRLSMDELQLKIAPTAGAPETLAAELMDQVKAATAVRPTVELVNPEEIYDPTATVKPKRILDLR
jgi:phenylacetate-coenzyme A ligase PaaK-like adenylate-forming protein